MDRIVFGLNLLPENQKFVFFVVNDYRINYHLSFIPLKNTDYSFY